MIWLIDDMWITGEGYNNRWIDRIDRMNVYGLISRNHDKYEENDDDRWYHEWISSMGSL